MVYGLDSTTMEYLLAAIYLADEGSEQQVDVRELRKEIEPYLSTHPEWEIERLHALEFRDFISTRGAGKVRQAGFFWVTEKGFEAAIEGRKLGFPGLLRFEHPILLS